MMSAVSFGGCGSTDVSRPCDRKRRLLETALEDGHTLRPKRSSRANTRSFSFQTLERVKEKKHKRIFPNDLDGLANEKKPSNRSSNMGKEISNETESSLTAATKDKQIENSSAAAPSGRNRRET